ncbi:MAG: GAF domain-containing protein [Roseiflexaceae bacterium]
MFQLLLSDAGYRVITAGTGEEALAYLDLVTPDLVLLDLMLPGVSGYDIARQIKESPERPFIPIILVTARGDQQTKVSGLDAGADDLLVKPVEFAELLARVRAMLRLQRSQRSLQAEQRKTELLLHLTRDLGTSLNLDQLLTHFLERLADSVGAVRASIVLVMPSGNRFYSSTHAQPGLPLDQLMRESLVGWVLRERQTVVIEETRDDPRWIMAPDDPNLVRSAAAVPILRDDQLFGAITLVHHTPGHFTEEHTDLLTSVAAQCAIALENAELFQLTSSQKTQLERRTEELQRLNQISQLLTELMRPDQLLRLVVHLIHMTFDYPMVSILLREGDLLVVRASAGSIGVEAQAGMSVPVGNGITGWVAAHHEPLSVPDVRLDPRFQQLAAGDQTRAELAVPIMSAREVVGVLDVMSATPNVFSQNDERLLQTLAGQIGVALQNARLFDTEKRRVRQLGQVNDLSVALTARLDPNEHLRIAAEAMTTIFEIERCGILVNGLHHSPSVRVVLSGRQRLDILREYNSFRMSMQQVAGLIELRTPQVIADVHCDERFEPLQGTLRNQGIDSLVLAPMISGGQPIGLIVIDASGRQDQFGQAELALLETVASLISQVLENARLYRQVEDERSTLDAVLDGAADPILLIGPQNELLLKNRAAVAQLGLNGTTGQPLSELIAQPDLLQVLSARNGDTPIAAHEVTLPQGETFSISVAPVRGSGTELLGRVAVLQDITAIKELERREQERIRNVFRRYVSPQVAEEVLVGGGDLGEPVERDLVVLFADLRNYTGLTEGLPPRVLVEQVLNRYFTAMTEVLYRHGGTIDKFLGDGIIGVFGWPISREDDLPRSLLAAVDLQRAFAELSRGWRSELGFEIGMGIGVGFGRAVVGNIGSAQRLDYTLVGDVVNTASRLSGLARAGQIIVSYHLVDGLPPVWRAPWPLRPLDRVSLKGKQEPHLIYEIGYQ